MTYPTLRERVERCLLDARFRAYGHLLPTRRSGGTFFLVSGVGAEVRVEWWDVTDEDRWGLLMQMRTALERAGWVVTPGRLGLHVAEPEKRSGEEAESPAQL